MTTQSRQRIAKRGLLTASALGLLGSLLLWACHLGPEDSQDTFDIVADTAWTHCHAVRILLLDGEGGVLDTLFNDSLASVEQLGRLDASKYRGGKAGLEIKGLNEDGSSCFEETRTFDDGATKVVVTPVLDPKLAPESLAVEPGTLVLSMGSAAASLKAAVFPAHANPGVSWSVDGSGVVDLEGLVEGKGNPVRVRPVKAGLAKVTVRSLLDAGKSVTVDVRVNDLGSGSIKIGRDTVFLFVKGEAESLTVSIPPEYAGQKVEWRIADDDIARVDAEGRIRPVAEGETQVRATLTPSGLSDVALVQVRRDVPRLRISSAKGAPVGGEIVFSPAATQEFGTLVSFRWDLLGDGTWDDTSTAGWSGDSVALPAVKQKYDREGTFVARFQVMDSEGNIGEAQVSVDIGNQAPEITFLRKDTVISIKDSISMEAVARDVDGKVAWAGWDYEGDGSFDDTLSGGGQELKVSLGHRYREAGSYNAVFRAVDENGKAGSDTVRIKVEFDEPVADAGPDLTVTAGGQFDFSVKGSDGFGAIAKRELKVGNGAFVALSRQDTVLTAPSQAGGLTIVVRVTDDDGLSDLDTALVTVVLSSNADLSGLAFSGGSLVPAFQPNAQNYAALVAFKDSLVTVRPKVKESSTKIVVNAKEVPSDSASEPVKLNLGSNPNAFQIIVTAADGSQRVYSLSVTRAPNSEATLAKLEAPGFTLAPDFSPSVLEYADTVPQQVASVSFKPTLASAGATLAFGDSGMQSGTYTSPQPLRFGENLFTFSVTSQDGKSTTAYRVRILRLGRIIISRKMGAAEPVVADTLNLHVNATRPLSGGSYAGWKFLGWTVTEGAAEFGDSTANPTPVTLKSGLAKVQASFERIRHTVDLEVKGCGKVSPGSDTTYDYGTSPEYRLTPAAGCRIQSVKVDGQDEPTAYDSMYTFVNLTANHTFEVQFARTYTVDWKVSGNGSVTPNPATVDSGTRAVFRMRPQAGYKVAMNGICAGNVCTNPRPDSTFVLDTVRANRSFAVTFVRGYKVTGTATAGAAVISPVDSLVDSNSTVTWRFSVGSNYNLDSLVVNGVSTKATSPGVYVVTGISKDVHVRLFTRRQYSLTVAYDATQGSVNQSTRLVDSGSTLNFTATPSAEGGELGGYLRVDTVLVNGATPPTTGTDAWSPRSWTIASLSANTTVRVTFRRYYKVTARNSDYHTVTPASANVDSGQSQAFTYTFNIPTGYYLEQLIFYKAPVLQYLSGNVLTLPSVTFGGTISANYSNMYTVAVNINIPKSGYLVPVVCFENGTTKTCTESPATTTEFWLPYGSTFTLSAPAQSSTGSRIAPTMHYLQNWTYGKGRIECDAEFKAAVTGNITYEVNYDYAKPPEGCTESPF